MNDTIGSRISVVRKDYKLTQSELASSIGLTKNYISLVETSQRNLSEQSMKVFCAKYQVNENWLLTGDGAPYNVDIDDRMIVLEALKHETDNPLYDMLMDILMTYIQLSDIDKAVIRKFVQSLIDKKNKDE